MKLGRDTASLTNAIMESFQGQPQPQVGMGATVHFYTDRAACTIIKVTDKELVLQEDHSERTDTNGMSESQTYSYRRNPNGRVYQFSKRRNGQWTLQGEKAGHGPGFTLGIRQAYYDYSF